MSRFTTGRHFIAFIGGLLSVMVLAGGLLDPDAPWPIAAVGAVGVAYMLTALVLYRIDNHGRGKTRRSRIQRRASQLLVGSLKPCGCWPESGSDTVESEPYVRRTMDGAQVRLEARKRQMRRCRSCGRHYHDTTGGRTRSIGRESELISMDTSGSLGIHRETVVWPEDEPDALDHITAPVERAE